MRSLIYRAVFLSWLITPVAWSWVWNNPYPAEDALKKIYYSSFSESPKTLDPAKSYNSNEAVFIDQIVEPLLEYDYYKRPYTLVPLLAASMPTVHYFDAYEHELSAQQVAAGQDVAYTVYRLALLPKIQYQPHPAFVAAYHTWTEDDLKAQGIQNLGDFSQTATREMTADDFIYQIKRLADPHVNSPIYGLMEAYIVGFKELNQALMNVSDVSWIDLRQFPLPGVKKIDDQHFEIRIYGQYRPFLYWLAMHFFSPTPWEVDRFYALPGMKDRNLGFDWNPVGTGPFMLTENNPNRRMVLMKNPYFREVLFPSHGSAEDKARGYTIHAHRKLPLIDEAVFTLEKESIPRWNKFLQGYYDASGISSDSFDQVIRVNEYGGDQLTPEMKSKGIRLVQTTEPAIYYFGFNMLDPVVGGSSERARLLRQAISLAINTEERIALFYNGRGTVAQGPIPLGIFGHQHEEQAYNQALYVHHQGHLKRRSLQQAKLWMKWAGYEDGIDPSTGQPLILNYDVSSSGAPDEKAELEWIRKQFAKLGIALNIRATQYNRFQEKMRHGNTQIFSWGWRADYPDPENFLFLLYGPNGEAQYGGENAANYSNPAFDELFQGMKNRDNDEERLRLIERMLRMVQYDAPWIWGLYSQTLTLSHAWVSPLKPNTMMTNTLKYVAIDPMLRKQQREAWNQVRLGPFGLILLGLLFGCLPLIGTARRQAHAKARRYDNAQMTRTHDV